MQAFKGQSISRSGPALAVIGAHAILIYAVATSLGIVDAPTFAKPLEAVIIDAPEQSRPQPVEMVKPELSEPVLDVPVPDTVIPIEIPVEAPVAQAAPAAPAVMESAAGSGPVSDAKLAVDRRVDPMYPPASRRAGEQGTGVFNVLVDERGKPRDVQVARSSGFPRLDQAAIEAIKRWAFTPATSGSEAVSAWTRVQVTFRLDQAK